MTGSTRTSTRSVAGTFASVSLIMGGIQFRPEDIHEVSWTDEEALFDAAEKRARKAAKRLRDAERVAAGRKGGV